MRVPKLKGFKNPFRVEYQADQPRHARGRRARRGRPRALLHEHGLVHKGALVKVLGRGELDPHGARCRPTRFSKAAEAAITAAGRYGGGAAPAVRAIGRPPAKGNHLTNR